MSERRRARRSLRRLALVPATLPLATLPACGGDGGTGPEPGDVVAVQVDLAPGERLLLAQPASGTLAFTLDAPDGGASYRLTVQSAAEAVGVTSMRLGAEGGSAASSPGSNVVGPPPASARSPAGGFRLREVSPLREGHRVRERLRRVAFEMLARRGTRASPGYRPGVRSRSMLPRGRTPSVGDTLLFWFAVQEDGRISCDTADAEVVTAEVAAVGERVAMVVDTAVALTAAEETQMDFPGLAEEFDDVVFGTDVAFFGEPSDIDGNGRVLVLFTEQVNGFSAAQEGNGLVAGFFAPTDLADSGLGGGAEATSQQDGVCETSNEAEVLWILAPDPDGDSGERVEIGQARRIARSTSAHEFEHMLNAANRVIERGGSFDQTEETWLDEGLAHLAEEVVGLQVLRRENAAIGLRRNVTFDQVTTSPETVGAFNTFLLSDFGNAARFLKEPAGTQALALSDPRPISESLKMRGMAWLFLRWLADHEAPDAGDPATGTGLPGSGEEEFFRELAADGDAAGGLETGIANVEAVTARDWPDLLAEFGLAVAVDDEVEAEDPRLRVRTWDLRSMYAGLSQNPGGRPFDRTFPLVPSEIPFGATTSVDFEVQAGGGRYFEVSSAGAGEVTLRLTDQTGAPLAAGSPQVAIIRIR